ncbi:MAG: SPOR domain-containing protein [Gammaproteobacteria bacterium]
MEQNRNLSGIIDTIQDEGPAPSLTSGLPGGDDDMHAVDRDLDFREPPAARHGYIRWLSFALLVLVIVSGAAGIAWQLLPDSPEQALVENSGNDAWTAIRDAAEEVAISPQAVTNSQAPGAASPLQEIHAGQAQIIARLDELAATVEDDRNRNAARWAEYDVQVKQLQDERRQDLDALSASIVALQQRSEQQAAAAGTPSAAPTAAVQGVTGDPAAGDGEWVVNVVSSTREKPVRDMMGKLQQQGIAVELRTATVDDTLRYRLQVPGFATRDAARRYADQLNTEHGLKGAWPSRK